MSPSLIYRFLKIHCRFALWFYFKKWQIIGKENVPSSGPLIYVANHQNAFLDPIVITCSASRNPYYLARATVFAKKWAATLLGYIRLKPIFRFRDGFSTLKNNDAILQECVDLLKKKEAILIFAEGNHQEPWFVSSFQKGFARIALMYYQQTGDASLQILPIGLHFTDHHAFNSRVLVQLGKPFRTSDFIKPELKERENQERLVDHCRNEIITMVLDIPHDEYPGRCEHLIRNRKYVQDQATQLETDREVLSTYPKESNRAKKNRSMLFWLALPNTLYLYLTHGPAKLFVDFVIWKKVSPKFVGSIKFAAGIFFVPVYYGVITGLVWYFTYSIVLTIAFLLSLPVSVLLGKATLDQNSVS